MSNTKTLEDAVAKTAATAAGWVAKVKALEIHIADWTRAVTAATAHRQQHALAASLGEAHAIAAIKKARSEQHDAEQHLVDLSIALPAAVEHLANAEKTAAAARHELALLRALGLKRQRIAAAARMDEAFAEVSAAFSEFDRLGRELQSFPDLHIAQSGMARWEDALGSHRVVQAVPIFLTTLIHRTSSPEPSQRGPLAVSEARFWSLLPEQPEKKAA